MGRCLENWFKKASTKSTRDTWRHRWPRFAEWAAPELNCKVDEVDEFICRDFEALPSNQFTRKYQDVLAKFVAYLKQGENKVNTILGILGSVRSFFANEAMEIKIRRGTLPTAQMAMGEHRFTLPELGAMYHVGDLESKARLSLAVALGWSIGDFIGLETKFVKEIVERGDEDGFAVFDYVRKKTKARVRGIITPDAVQDLKAYLPKVKGDRLWSTRTVVGFNYWMRNMAKEAGIRQNGQIRFHLLRKYVYDIVSSQVGVYEAKLLVGKRIPLADETYLHGLEDRLLERYKKFAYPLLKLNGSGQGQLNGVAKSLEEKLEKQSQVLDYLQAENVRLKEGMASEVEDLKRELEQRSEIMARAMEEKSQQIMEKAIEKMYARVETALEERSKKQSKKEQAIFEDFKVKVEQLYREKQKAKTNE